MDTSSNSCFPSNPQPGQASHMYAGHDHHSHQEVLSTTTFDSSSGLDTSSTSLLYNLSLLKEKFNQINSLVGICISPNPHSQTPPQSSTVIAMTNIGTLLQEIIITASSMMFTCQQISLGSSSSGKISNVTHESLFHKLPNEGLLSHANYNETLDWFDQGYGNNPSTCYISKSICQESSAVENSEKLSSKGYDIIEMDAADLLAKYTHYCQICGKGFKRDANLRMHMRAHGDEYKSSAALSNPMKKNSTTNLASGTGTTDGEELSTNVPRKYSCPQEGCRWNRKHEKFQPLKSMICVKNHYKRSHCPKMYVCKRCNRKQFSVLSDLRTHEKHCGDLKWQCSCGTTFSRKDKLMGHVGLFVGHTPVVVNSVMARSRNVKIGSDEQIS